MFKKAASLARLDFAPGHQHPSAPRVILATVVSIAGSLAADWLCVAIAVAIWPGTKNYQHFQFADYSKLTIVGVIIACLAWPITTRITSHPRWMFFRMAVIVTLVLWLPDVAIAIMGQPGNAVGTLFVMHVAIALVTYNALVHVAPVRARHPEPDRPAVPVAR